MSESVFTSQTPAVDNASDGVTYTLGTIIRPAVNGIVSAVRWFFPTSLPSGPVIPGVYSWTSDTTGDILTTGAAFAAPVAGAWNQASVTPINVTGLQFYVPVIFTPDRYVASGGLLASAIINGNLTAPANDNVTPRHNGKFADAVGSMSFPSGSGGGSAYFVDWVFDAATGARQSDFMPFFQ